MSNKIIDKEKLKSKLSGTGFGFFANPTIFKIDYDSYTSTSNSKRLEVIIYDDHPNFIDYLKMHKDFRHQYGPIYKYHNIIMLVEGNNIMFYNCSIRQFDVFDGLRIEYVFESFKTL